MDSLRESWNVLFLFQSVRSACCGTLQSGHRGFLWGCKMSIPNATLEKYAEQGLTEARKYWRFGEVAFAFVSYANSTALLSLRTKTPPRKLEEMRYSGYEREGLPTERGGL